VEPASTRARRALTLMGLAVVALTAAGAVYLGPGLVRSVQSTSQPPAPRPTAVPRLQLRMAFFGDADHGAVTMIGPSPAIYQTSNGGHTWIKHPPGALAMTFLDRDHGVAWGQGRLETTTDSGLTWRSSQVPFSLGSFSLLVGGGIVGGPTFLDPANAWWLDAGPVRRLPASDARPRHAHSARARAGSGFWSAAGPDLGSAVWYGSPITVG